MTVHKKKQTREYVHKQPGEEGNDLPWIYSLITEGRFTHSGREVLYVTGSVIGGCVCIGAGSVRFIHVPGYIISYHGSMDNQLHPVSVVEPVIREENQNIIRKILSEKHPDLQVCFL